MCSAIETMANQFTPGKAPCLKCGITEKNLRNAGLNSLELAVGQASLPVSSFYENRSEILRTRKVLNRILCDSLPKEYGDGRMPVLRKPINRRRAIFRSRLKNHRREIGMVHRVRVMLSLQAEGAVLFIRFTSLA